jgi:hypothetical protein
MRNKRFRAHFSLTCLSAEALAAEKEEQTNDGWLCRSYSRSLETRRQPTSTAGLKFRRQDRRNRAVPRLKCTEHGAAESIDH